MSRLSILVLRRILPPLPPAVPWALLTEAWRYLSGPSRSRLRQQAALHDLDNWLRRDLGLPRRLPPPLDSWPGLGW